jgi:hypothetical protein
MSKADTEKKMKEKLMAQGSLSSPAPQSEGMDYTQMQQMFGQPDAATAPQESVAELPPGHFKDDPQGAINHISQMLASKATGLQLNTGKTPGSLTARMPVDQPLAALFGMKKNVPVSSPNFMDTLGNTLGQETTAKLLPHNLPRTPEGQPFVSKDVFDQVMQASAKEDGKRLLSPEESKLTIGYWKEAAPSLVPLAESIMATQGGLPEWLGKQGPSYRLKRSEYGTVQGFTEEGEPVEQDPTTRKWFVGGKETPAENVGRLLSKTRPQMTEGQMNEVTNLLNSKSQINEIKRLFDPSAVGPVQDKLLSFQELTGIKLPDLHGISVMTDDKMKLRTVMGSNINDYIKTITGAAMSEPEARRIMRTMPKAGASDDAFLPVLAEIAKLVETKLDNRLDVLETQDTVGIKKLRELSSQRYQETKPKAKKPLGDIFGGK